MSEADFNIWLSSAKCVTHFKGLMREHVPSMEEWKRLIIMHPAIAVQLSAGGWLAPEWKWFNSPEFAEPIVGEVLRKPTSLSRCNVLLWGRLLGFASVTDADSLRSAFTSAAVAQQDDVYFHYPFDHEIFPYEVDLPTESQMVPLILAAAVHYVSDRREMWRHQSAGVKEHDPVEDLGRVVKQFFPVSSYLENGAFDVTKPSVDAGYRMLLRVLHPEIKGKFSELLEFIPELVAVAPDRRFLDIVLFYVRIRCSEEDPSVVRMVSRLIESLRGDFALRIAFHPLLHAWREKSHSPATKAGALAKWL